MRILVTGKGGKAGSWQIRGEQLGAAIGAKVKPMASLEDCKSADLIIVVKRVPDTLLDNIRRSKKPWIFDCVDFYPQPACTSWSRDAAVAWVRERMSFYHPTGVVWPNENMLCDCTAGRKEVVVRHHYRPGLAVNPIRPNVSLVNYEGAADYLGEWSARLVDACKERGWTFSINAPHYTAADIVVAFRGTAFAGYAQRNWKSNVKLANAHGSGTPFIGQPESGYLESSTGLEFWVHHPEAIGHTLDALADQQRRRQISERFLRSAYALEDAALDMLRFANGL